MTLRLPVAGILALAEVSAPAIANQAPADASFHRKLTAFAELTDSQLNLG